MSLAVIGTFLMTLYFGLALGPLAVAVATIAGSLDLGYAAILSASLGLMLSLVHQSLAYLLRLAEAGPFGTYLSRVAFDEDEEGHPARPPMWENWQGGLSYGLLYTAASGGVLLLFRFFAWAGRQWAFGPKVVAPDGQTYYALAPALIVAGLLVAGALAYHFFLRRWAPEGQKVE